MITYHRLSLRDTQISLLMIVLSLTLVGCLGSTTIPQDHYYRFPEQFEIPKNISYPPIKTIAVEQLKTEGLYRERSLLFVDAKNPLELQQYHYRHWIKVPTYLIQDNMVQFFRQAKLANSVIRYEPRLEADITVSGRLLNFEQIIGSDITKVKVTIEIEIVKNNSSPDANWHKVYEANENVNSDTIHDAVEAFGRALNKVYAILLSDIAKQNSQ